MTTRRHVLIVDDSPILRRVVARSLAVAGVELAAVYQAGDGQEALAVMAAHQVDLVLADINMPVMSGVELVEKMAANGSLAKTTVVMLTSDRSEERMAALKHLGVAGYLTKPFRPEALRDVLSAIPPRSV